MAGERKFWSREVVEGRGPEMVWDRAGGGVVCLERSRKSTSGAGLGLSRVRSGDFWELV